MHDLEAVLPIVHIGTGLPTLAGPTVTGAAAVPPAAAGPATVSPTLSATLIARPGISRIVASRTALAGSILPLPSPTLLTEADVNNVASDYGDVRLGDGLDRLKAAFGATPLDQTGELWLGGSGRALALDQAALAAANADMATFVDSVRKAVANKDTTVLDNIIAGAA